VTRPNGLDVPAGVVALVAAQPFRVTVRPEARPGMGDALLLTEGASRWHANASYGYNDPVRGWASATTLRTAVLHAIEARAVVARGAARRGGVHHLRPVPGVVVLRAHVDGGAAGEAADHRRIADRGGRHSRLGRHHDREADLRVDGIVDRVGVCGGGGEGGDEGEGDEGEGRAGVHGIMLLESCAYGGARGGPVTSRSHQRDTMSCRGVMSTSRVNFKPNSSSSRFLASFPWLISCGFKGRLPSHPYKI
jgi:hypothetical protein